MVCDRFGITMWPEIWVVSNTALVNSIYCQWLQPTITEMSWTTTSKYCLLRHSHHTANLFLIIINVIFINLRWRIHPMTTGTPRNCCRRSEIHRHKLIMAHGAQVPTFWTVRLAMLLNPHFLSHKSVTQRCLCTYYGSNV